MIDGDKISRPSRHSLFRLQRPQLGPGRFHVHYSHMALTCRRLLVDRGGKRKSLSLISAEPAIAYPQSSSPYQARPRPIARLAAEAIGVTEGP